MASSIAPALTHTYITLPMKKGQLPDDWKRAFETSLFKKGDKGKAANYRPVALTSCCCKVMEHKVHSHLMNILENNKILSDFQHGFWKRRSCETQLITTIYDLAVGLDKWQQVDTIIMYFSTKFLIRFHIIAWQSTPSLWHQRQKPILDPKFPCR